MRHSSYGLLLAAGLTLPLFAASVQAQDIGKDGHSPAPATETSTRSTNDQEPSPPKTGEKAPDFTLKGGDGKSHTLSDYRGRWVVLNFYPANFTKG